jgi:hypothetical protein
MNSTPPTALLRYTMFKPHIGSITEHISDSLRESVGKMTGCRKALTGMRTIERNSKNIDLCPSLEVEVGLLESGCFPHHVSDVAIVTVLEFQRV